MNLKTTRSFAKQGGEVERHAIDILNDDDLRREVLRRAAFAYPEEVTAATQYARDTLAQFPKAFKKGGKP